LENLSKLPPPPCPSPSRGRVWEGVKKGNYYTKNKDHKLRVGKAIKPFNYSTTQPFNQI
jgi:hypothetical protein